jgi:hypothetical protein
MLYQCRCPFLVLCPLLSEHVCASRGPGGRNWDLNGSYPLSAPLTKSCIGAVSPDRFGLKCSAMNMDFLDIFPALGAILSELFCFLLRTLPSEFLNSQLVETSIAINESKLFHIFTRRP